MKTVVFAVLLGVVAWAGGPATEQRDNRPISALGRQLIAINQELIDGLARSDISVAQRIYADDFIRITLDGGLLTKTQVISALKTPAAGVKITYESKDIQVFEYGDAAVLTYLSIRHTDSSNGRSDFRYRVADTFVRRNGVWLKAVSAGTPVATGQ